jgi:itaconate CoA-transferase
MTGALDGVLVLSVEQAVAAPYCARLLADAGARVIKVERPDGDFARSFDRAAGDLSSYFLWLNRGKESLVADLKSPGDAALLRAILARADVFIQNLAPGAAGRLGLSSTELRSRHRRLITVDISGYDEDGPDYERKAYDLLIQAEAGLAAINGHPAGPGRVGISVCDYTAGLSAYSQVLEALLERSRTGVGRAIKVSLFSAMAEWMAVPLLQHERLGAAPERTGLTHPTICPYGAFQLQDGSLILIAIQNEREWANFCAQLLGDKDLSVRPGFESNVARVANRVAVDGLVAAALVRLQRDTAVAKLNAADIAFGFVNDVAGLARHPALRRVSVDTPHGRVSMAAPVGRSAGLGRVPALGEHTAKIRGEFSSSPTANATDRTG